MAKQETLNSFVFNFASTNAQMQRVAIYSLLGLPEVRSSPSYTPCLRMCEPACIRMMLSGKSLHYLGL